MSITYKCTHCGNKVGQLEQSKVDQTMLGIQELTKEERSEMVQQADDGKLEIRSICESCESMLQEHPQYHELDYFIH